MSHGMVPNFAWGAIRISGSSVQAIWRGQWSSGCWVPKHVYIENAVGLSTSSSRLWKLWVVLLGFDLNRAAAEEVRRQWSYCLGSIWNRAAAENDGRTALVQRESGCGSEHDIIVCNTFCVVLLAWGCGKEVWRKVWERSAARHRRSAT